MPRKTIHKPIRRKTPIHQSNEWIGGHFPGPFHVTDADEPYRPSVVTWVESPSGLIVGHDICRPGEELETLGRTLATALWRPLAGPARRPGKLRVADEALAAEVRAVVDGEIPVSVAATPELEDVKDAMKEATETGLLADPEGDGMEEFSYFHGGRVSPAVVTSLFAAARLLAVASPWKRGDERDLVRVDIPDLDVDGACLVIMGATTKNHGFLLFPSLSAYEAFAEAACHGDMKLIDLGTSWYSFLLVPGDEIPPSMQREAKENGWEIHDELSYPSLEYFEADGLLRPLTERDVKIISACATSFMPFYIQNERAFGVEDAEPTCQSFSDNDDLTVRFTLPYEAASLFDVNPPRAEAAAARPKRIGRNEPCPCGSGKKYKKCHLAEDRGRDHKESRLDELARIDAELTERMLNFAVDRFGAGWFGRRTPFPDSPDADLLQLLVPWALHHHEVEGRPVCEWFRRSARLSAGEKVCLDAHRRAWLSIWEVTDADPGVSLTLHDPLTGEVRKVTEKTASRNLKKGDSIVARVVRFGDTAILCGLDPRSLPPMDAGKVIEQVRARLRLKRVVPPERLQKKTITSYLIRRWREGVERYDRTRSAPPEIRGHSKPGASGPDGPAAPPPPELGKRFMHEFQERYYAGWPDVSVPALGGSTPRAKVRTKKGRQEVDLLVREMESQDQQRPAEQRYDFTKLRRALGLD